MSSFTQHSNNEIKDIEVGANESLIRRRPSGTAASSFVTPGTESTWSSASTLSASFRLNAPQRDDSTLISSLTTRKSKNFNIEELHQDGTTTERNSFASTFSMEVPIQQQSEIAVPAPITETAIVEVKSQGRSHFILDDGYRQQSPPDYSDIPVAQSTEFVTSMYEDSKNLEYGEYIVHTPIHPGLALSSPITQRTVASTLAPSPKPDSADYPEERWQQKYCSRRMESLLCYSVCVLVLGLVAAVIVLSVELTQQGHNNNSQGTSTAGSIPGSNNSTLVVQTLDTIQERGTLLCGIVDQIGFSVLNLTSGQRQGFEIDLVSSQLGIKRRL
jgi:hypothetical protein